MAAAAQNPIASNISLPVESSLFFGTGPDEEPTFVANLQPVVPVGLGDDWNLINRPILPIIDIASGPVEGLPSNPGQPSDFEPVTGLGDLNYTGFFSPKGGGSVTWGVGPSITLPTATDDVLGSGQWSIGPSFVVLNIQKPWLYGVLLRHLWSFAGDSDRANVNQSLVQPFANYNFDGGWYLTSAPILLSNWDEPSSERWTVPLGGGFGKLTRVGGLPLNINLQAYYNAVRPDGAAEWQLRLLIQVLLPK